MNPAVLVLFLFSFHHLHILFIPLHLLFLFLAFVTRYHISPVFLNASSHLCNRVRPSIDPSAFWINRQKQRFEPGKLLFIHFRRIIQSARDCIKLKGSVRPSVCPLARRISVHSIKEQVRKWWKAAIV